MIGISEIGFYLPENLISNYDRLVEFNLNEDFIENKSGFKNLTKCHKNESASQMCVKSFYDLISKCNVEIDQIDCCIVITQNPDYKLPHVSAIVHKELGLNDNCACFDISLGCSGYVYGLSVIKSFMESNNLINGLLFTSDPYSKIIDINDKSTSLLFGDGATVTLIKENPNYEIKKFSFGTLGDSYSDLLCKEKLKMNGRGIFAFASRKVPLDIKLVLEKNGLIISDIDLFIIHQGSKFIVDTIREKLLISEEKMKFCASDYGNLISSSIPMILKDHYKNGKDKILLSGFGVGLSWSSTVLIKIQK